jgi:hypothetical protein
MEELLPEQRTRKFARPVSFIRHTGFKNNLKKTVRKKYPDCWTDYSVTRRIIPDRLLSSRACFRFILQCKCKLIVGFKHFLNCWTRQRILGLNLRCKPNLGLS